ncbi:uncharacterized protein LOC123301098 isoform X2 [Chrysoperla carnea]|uniref:uncharacterized protein LOC123301098 isoform X2 n=1 Tax=Chrysoperla carnea TaxID=189513 RepID=UPI001D07B6B2|nr:uncharacterized protein LOC123301098 isoform X2 [Chrysoperla carnea]
MYFEWSEFQNSSVDLTTHDQKLSGTAVNGISDEKSDGSTNSKKASEESTSNIIKNSNSQSRLARSHQTEHTSSLQSLSIGEIMEAPEADNMGVTAILNYCKCKILRPYLRLLASIGFRPISLDIPDTNICVDFLSVFYLLVVIIFLIIGYLLQYMSCFRRDRGFCYTLVPLLATPYENAEERAYRQICYGSTGFSYIIPSVLHFSAYLYSLYLFRVSNNEQFQSMMERVFLLSSGPYDGSSGQRGLLKTLWIFIGCSVVWTMLSLVIVSVMLEEGNITFQWIQTRFYFMIPTYSTLLISTLKILTVICTFLHDMAQALVICSYCIQAQLLKSHLHFLRARLMQHFLSPLEWMREIAEFRKSLNYLNDGLAPAVCIFTIVNLSWASSGFLWLMRLDSMDVQTQPIIVISILNVLLWSVIALAPFLQASRLTASCILMQTIGHDIRTRPLAYQSTPGQELDSIVLYASSLRMNAKLFKVPITGRCLYLTITVLAIVILTLGQCHYFEIAD